MGWADLKTGFSDSTLWNGKTAVDLGGTGLSGADGINDVGQMSGTCGSHACTLSNGTLTQLPNPSNVAGCNGGPINNSGEVM